MSALQFGGSRARVSVGWWHQFAPRLPIAANDHPGPPVELEFSKPSVALATFPNVILLTIEGDDDLAAEWRRLYPTHQRAQAEDAAYQLAEFYGLPLRSDDCTHVQVTHG